MEWTACPESAVCSSPGQVENRFIWQPERSRSKSKIDAGYYTDGSGDAQYEWDLFSRDNCVSGHRSDVAKVWNIHKSNHSSYCASESTYRCSNSASKSHNFSSHRSVSNLRTLWLFQSTLDNLVTSITKFSNQPHRTS